MYHTFALLSFSLPLSSQQTDLSCKSCLAHVVTTARSLKVLKPFGHQTTFEVSSRRRLLLGVTQIGNMAPTVHRRLTVLQRPVLVAHIVSAIRELTFHHRGTTAYATDWCWRCRRRSRRYSILGHKSLPCESSPEADLRSWLLPIWQPSMLLQVLPEHMP